MIKLDQNIKTAQERVEYIKEKLTGEENQRELIYAANYILFAEKNDKIISDNRNITVTKRETSFEGICSKLENGENGIYNLISGLGKQAYLTIKDPITEEDYENIPELREITEALERLEKKLAKTPPGKKYPIKKQILELRDLRKLLKTEYTHYMHLQPNSKTIRNLLTFTFDENITITEDGDVISDGKINFFNPKHISAILCNYSKLRQDC